MRIAVNKATVKLSGWLSAGKIANIRPNARSCAIKIANITWPGIVLVSPFSVKVLRTTAVEESERTAPRNIPWTGVFTQPKVKENKATKVIVIPIWRMLPFRAISLTLFNSARENSTPKVNKSKATPISAKDLISSTLLINPKPKGPMIRPENKYPSNTG